MKKILLLLPILFCFQTIFAQSHRTLNLIEKTNYTLFGGSIGGAYYSGTYANQSFNHLDFGSIKPNFNLFIQHKFARKWHVKFQAGYINIGSNDNYESRSSNGESNPNYNQKAFNTHIMEVLPLFILDLGVDRKSKSRGTYKGRKANHWNWYLQAGIGTFVADVNNNLGGWSGVKPGGLLAGGLGVRYALKEKLVFNLDALLRVPSTKHLDGAPQQALPADLYGTLNFGVAYRLPGRRFLR
ncbi:hypothetical protein KMW28_13685 [Flammeovirga yaeyamensis]|uniref:Outer membrane protein beta-barrel domain-containing protein n=1 Tax=Flammeovirga yaeyamensis TaxID=367791 RepID=A0AAX1MZF4_9BACT|nr:hypothetical protein [Flammeovirga yaeyamensis]MBB3700946.1 hypothetical protein [Flammeovirga yaeyamensis]NMF38053.1 hypothetical protein [Flammeovirga yaeyamensis]QWG00703.1 hypothetical protein KMW28_13685 [Flammeovirga yaeyamensis]